MTKKITSFDRVPTFSGHVKIEKDNNQHATSGEPAEADNNLYTDKSGKFIAGSWECTAGILQLTNYDMEEYCFIKEGELVITDEDGTVTTHKAGDSFVIPRGFNGVWDMK